MNWIWFASRSAIRYLTPASSPPTASAAPIVAAMAPSSMNGSWMKTFDAPTKRMMPVSRFRLSAESRKRETGIMRLVGASNVFIQLPFMLEGAIAAAIGAGLAVGGLWLGVKYLVTDWLGSSVTFVDYIDTGNVWSIAPYLAAVAIVLAM